MNKTEEVISKIENREVQSLCEIISKTDYKGNLSSDISAFTNLIPELKDMIGFCQNNPYHDFDVYEHTIHALKGCKTDDMIVRLAVFFHDFGKPHSYQDGEDGVRHFKGHGRVSAMITRDIMERLCFDKDTITSVCELVAYHDATFRYGKKYVKRWLNKIGNEQFVRLLELRKSDIKGQKLDYDKLEVKNINRIESLICEVSEEIEKDTSNDIKLDINGNDLISIGYAKNKNLGDTLKILQDCVKEEIVSNKKEDLLRLASTYLEEKERN